MDAILDRVIDEAVRVAGREAVVRILEELTEYVQDEPKESRPEYATHLIVMHEDEIDGG